ncbi:MAG: hypothetical protein M4579_007121 [Chaenotheca gracillima]|nr:MAG: hypothetical protein M4579_007121 [Chaenotheca gracillima]
MAQPSNRNSGSGFGASSSRKDLSTSDPTLSPQEIYQKQLQAAAKLESWESLAMHCIASEESGPQARLRLETQLAGLNPNPRDTGKPSSSFGAGAGRKRQQQRDREREQQRREAQEYLDEQLEDEIEERSR